MMPNRKIRSKLQRWSYLMADDDFGEVAVVFVISTLISIMIGTFIFMKFLAANFGISTTAVLDRHYTSTHYTSKKGGGRTKHTRGHYIISYWVESQKDTIHTEYIGLKSGMPTKKGTPINIKYSAFRPTNIYAPDFDNSFYLAFMFIPLGISCTLSAIYMRRAVSKQIERLPIFQYGLITTGKITEISPVKDYFTYKFEFEIVQKKHNDIIALYENNPELKIDVIYNPRKPSEYLLFSKLYRPPTITDTDIIQPAFYTTILLIVLAIAPFAAIYVTIIFF